MKETGYFAPEGLEDALKDELLDITGQYGRLILAKGEPQQAYWAQNIWYEPMMISFESISQAAKKLSSLNKLWSYYPIQNIRRAQLIIEQLPYFSPKPIEFPGDIPKEPLGSWTLIDPHTLIASPKCSSPFANGEIHFQESKIPPSRAYLKLWEIFLRIGVMPKPNEKCLELGASPGSWTWVLQQLRASVTAIDRAPIVSSIAQLPNVIFHQKDAFSILAQEIASFDWVFSDVICYPEKLLTFIQESLAANVHVNWVCTIKFQGKIDRSVIQEFAKIPNSRIFHLFHNKHELSWVSLRTR